MAVACRTRPAAWCIAALAGLLLLDGGVAEAAQEFQATELSLRQVVRLAVQNGRTVEIAYRLREAEAFAARAAEEEFEPRLDLATAISRQHFAGQRSTVISLAPTVTMALPTGGVAAAAVTNSYGWTMNGQDAQSRLDFTLIQPLLAGGGMDVGTAELRISRIAEQQSRLRVRSVVSDAVTSAVLAYRTLVRAQEQRAIAEAARDRARDLLAVNAALIGAGRMAAADMVQTEAEIAARDLGLIEAEGRVDTARADLLNLLGIDPRSPVRATDPGTFERFSLGSSALIETAMANRPDLLMLALTIEADRIRLAAERNRTQWQLDAVASGGGEISHSDSGLRAPGGPSWSAGMQLIIPLTGLARYQGEVSARVTLEANQIRYEQLREEITRQILESVRLIGTHRAQIEVATRAVALSRRKLEIERTKLRAGRSSNFQVLAFENDLRVAELAEAEARLAHADALTRFDSQVGTVLDTWGLRVEQTPLRSGDQEPGRP